MSEISPSDLDPQKKTAISIDGASRKQQSSGKHGVSCRFAGGFVSTAVCPTDGAYRGGLPEETKGREGPTDGAYRGGLPEETKGREGEGVSLSGLHLLMMLFLFLSFTSF
ncbi:hypothetical protein MRB53_027381 [Persea americana]|uniref:Uncharacterized protein n=1 Tax=Persea americana TaxID=3435 RepID=A0ACC2LKY9_PERAE|nr:hypothetical protein MRB53_027381 [Persea americana]